MTVIRPVASRSARKPVLAFILTLSSCLAAITCSRVAMAQDVQEDLNLSATLNNPNNPQGPTGVTLTITITRIKQNAGIDGFPGCTEGKYKAVLTDGTKTVPGQTNEGDTLEPLPAKDNNFTLADPGTYAASVDADNPTGPPGIGDKLGRLIVLGKSIQGTMPPQGTAIHNGYSTADTAGCIIPGYLVYRNTTWELYKYAVWFIDNPKKPEDGTTELQELMNMYDAGVKLHGGGTVVSIVVIIKGIPQK